MIRRNSISNSLQIHRFTMNALMQRNSERKVISMNLRNIVDDTVDDHSTVADFPHRGVIVTLETRHRTMYHPQPKLPVAIIVTVASQDFRLPVRITNQALTDNWRL
jgi:hypothetical protein